MYQVSITSHRPGRTPQDAQVGLDAWKTTLETAGISDASVQMSIGGWEGGREPTFFTRITEGELERILFAAAQFANATEQNTAFVLAFSGDREDPDAEPVHEIGFSGRLATSQMRFVERALTSVGIGGWTWSKREGRTLLQIAFIPEWSEHTRDGHYDRVAAVSAALSRAGIDHTIAVPWAVRHLLDADSYRDYLR